ncbi:MAG: PAS domain-containing protein [Gammaproteobacteria bacterium]|nr:PAS domain-containing protein [Gammaproteobacteria bacterium]
MFKKNKKMYTNSANILDNLNIVIIVLNSNVQIQYINPAAEMFFSTSRNRIHNKLLNSLIYDKDLTKNIIKSIESGNTFVKREYTLNVNLQPSIVDLSVTPVIDKDKNLEVILEIIPQDKNLKISREENLVSQQQASKELLRSMAHEVKNPLGGIRGAAQLLEKELDTEELREYTQVIIDEADRLKLLVDRMLGPKTLPNKNWINIHYVTERVRSLMNIDKNYPIDVFFDYDPSIPDIYADAEHLIQAVLNLTKNAAQSITECKMCENKQIILKSRVKRNFTIGSSHYLLVLKLDIIDTGPGIDKQMIEHIFMPLITGRAQGTGLGLSIAQSLVNKNSGLIECTSVPGNTVFSVLLPINSNQEAGEKEYE